MWLETGPNSIRIFLTDSETRAEQLAIYRSTTADLDLLIVSGVTDFLIGLECSIMRKVYGQ